MAITPPAAAAAVDRSAARRRPSPPPRHRRRRRLLRQYSVGCSVLVGERVPSVYVRVAPCTPLCIVLRRLAVQTFFFFSLSFTSRFLYTLAHRRNVYITRNSISRVVYHLQQCRLAFCSSKQRFRDPIVFSRKRNCFFFCELSCTFI